MHKIFTAFIVLSILLTRSPAAFAEPVSLKLDPVCCTGKFTDDAGKEIRGVGYKVYGEDTEQPKQVGEECRVQVEIPDPLTVSAEEITQAGAPPAQGLPTIGDINNSTDGRPADFFKSVVKTGGKAALQALTNTPLNALFSSLAGGLKKDLSSLLKTVFKGHTEKYHAFMDKEIFGKAISTVSRIQSSDEWPTYLRQNEGNCGPDNPKPNCVIERALCSYEKYSGVLFQQAGKQLLDSSTASSDTQTIIAVLQKRDQALLQENADAQQALDTAIAVYSQFFETYRLHLRLKEVITALVKVRNMTSFLHQLVGCIPNKFVGVATTKCN